MIAINKAWRSAEVVRREWLSSFLARRTPPAGAEAVICEAVVTSQWTLIKAIESRHSMLRDLLGITAATGGVPELCQRLTVRPSTPKTSTMLSLACVVAAWEQSTGSHTWCNPSDWDRRVMSALAGWGYPPSEIKSLLTRTDSTQPESSSGTEPGAEQERSEGAEVSAPHPSVVSEA
ncbi:hypothetical protein [Aquipuribacter hungaricus]|uniref:Regulatory protein RecX n=1 Tax=Aquipuribacter hungaricus TaxID=545624 RepID=A0ABV7WFD2_9MICO